LEIRKKTKKISVKFMDLKVIIARDIHIIILSIAIAIALNAYVRFERAYNSPIDTHELDYQD
jgi:hypothetical protein